MATAKKTTTKTTATKAKTNTTSTSNAEVEALKKTVTTLKKEVANLKKSLAEVKLASGNKDVQLRNAILDWAQSTPTTRVYSNFVKNGITRS